MLQREMSSMKAMTVKLLEQNSEKVRQVVAAPNNVLIYGAVVSQAVQVHVGKKNVNTLTEVPHPMHSRTHESTVLAESVGHCLQNTNKIQTKQTFLQGFETFENTF